MAERWDEDDDDDATAETSVLSAEEALARVLGDRSVSLVQTPQGTIDSEPSGPVDLDQIEAQLEAQKDRIDTMAALGHRVGTVDATEGEKRAQWEHSNAVATPESEDGGSWPEWVVMLVFAGLAAVSLFLIARS